MINGVKRKKKKTNVVPISSATLPAVIAVGVKRSSTKTLQSFLVSSFFVGKTNNVDLVFIFFCLQPKDSIFLLVFAWGTLLSDVDRPWTALYLIVIGAMPRWSRKRIPLPILTALFIFLVVSSIIYNENKRQVQELEDVAAAADVGRFPSSVPMANSSVRRKGRDLGGFWNSCPLLVLEYLPLFLNSFYSQLSDVKIFCVLCLICWQYFGLNRWNII